MTKTLQDLIDEAIFISTEHQARLAELTGESDWAVDFSAPSFSLKSDPSVTLTPYLLGTESEQRGSWIWAWQELGHFPAQVVSAAVQSREAGERLGVQELATDELLLSEGLARRLTLAAKAATGIWAHYPATAGGGVRAWLLVDGPQFELPEPTVQRMGRVMAQALQTGTAVHHQRAVDSYARLRGAHISWDTEACAVITAADGALRLWFDEQTISGIEQAEPVVGQKELQEAARAAAEYRQHLRAEAQEALRLAEEESEQQRRAREQAEAERVAATQQALQEQGEPAGVVRTSTGGADAPFDQDPRTDAEPGLVTTHVYEEDQPSAAQQTEQERYAGQERYEAPEPRTEREPEADTEAHEVLEPVETAPAEELPAEQAPAAEAAGQPESGKQGSDQRSALERLRAQSRGEEPAAQPSERPAQGAGQPAERQGGSVRAEQSQEAPAEAERPAEKSEQQGERQKKGFFKRFLGL